jgi:hypothetical protein
MQINDPVVLAELTALHELYEKALIDNDAATLDAFFWDSRHALRFGVAENLHGWDEIRAFRKGRPKINLERVIERLDIISFGDGTGIINLEFRRAMDGIERRGRQTQFWFRFPDGWKIVSAHVSLMPSAPSYLEAASAEIGLKLPAASRGFVQEDLNQIANIARLLMEFPLAQDIEAAPVFQP